MYQLHGHKPKVVEHNQTIIKAQRTLGFMGRNLERCTTTVKAILDHEKATPAQANQEPTGDCLQYTEQCSGILALQILHTWRYPHYGRTTASLATY